MERKKITSEEEARADLGPERSRPPWLERQPLPFAGLSPDEFEVYCFLLWRREYPGHRVDDYGKSHDAGRDIVHRRPDGKTCLIQCKRYTGKVGVSVIRSELAKLYVNVFRGVIPEKPDQVVFCVATELTSPAKDLLQNQNKWRAEARAAICRHLHSKPPQDLLDFCNRWWPDSGFDWEGSLGLTERSRRHPPLIDEFFGVQNVIDGSLEDVRRIVREEVDPLRPRWDEIRDVLRTSPAPPSSQEGLPDATGLPRLFKAASQCLLRWPTTLGDGRWLERAELTALSEKVYQAESSTTLLLGPPGSGKSALLARLGLQLQEASVPVLGIKADHLEPRISSLGRLAERLRLPALPADCVRALAERGKVVVLIDQMDALADLVDLRSERLNVLLDLVRDLGDCRNVHVVCSCRSFESRHDVRLAGLEAEKIELGLPPWQEVSGVLRGHGVEADNWPEEVRKSLRTPQHLKVFLEHLRGTSAGEVYTSYQQMLDQLWTLKVTNGDGLPGRAGLLMEMARVMTEEEQFWLPRARFQEDERLLTCLEAEGILARDDGGGRIGFRHQTFLEHARARAFARGDGGLARHVLERQDALFVRPTLWAGLTYLREVAPAAYEWEMEEMLHSGARRHVMHLLIDFLGQVPDPSDREEAWLLGLLGREDCRNGVLRAIQGNRGWFERLAGSHFPPIMARPAEKCWPMVGVIQQAWCFARRECLDLIERTWMGDPGQRRLAARALWELDEWDEEVTDLACRIVREMPLEGWAAALLAAQAAKKTPHLAPRILAVAWKKALAEMEKPAEGSEEESGPATPGKVRGTGDVADRYRKFLREPEGCYEASQIAKAAPQAFLDELWPLYVSVLERFRAERQRVLYTFRQDQSGAARLDETHDAYSLTTSMHKAVCAISREDPPAFRTFLDRWKALDSMVAQRLLARGLMANLPQLADAALSFLAEDPRRLMLGDYGDDLYETRSLIWALGRHGSDQQVADLEEAILRSSQYRPEVREEADFEVSERAEYDREHRARLLSGIPLARRSAQARTLLGGDAGEASETPPTKSRESPFRRIESPMSADQMAAATDEEILKLFDDLVDGAVAHHPRDWMVGGSVQASQAFGEFTKSHPHRAAALFGRFRPRDQESPVASTLRPLAETDYPSDQLFHLIVDLHAKGFQGEDFRGEAAWALHKRAEKPHGLPDAVCDLLVRWLAGPWTLREQEESQSGDDGQEGREPQSILWGYQGGITLPHGSYQVLEALTWGLLLRDPPEVGRWLSILEGHLERPESVETWRAFSLELRYLRRCDARRAERFLERLFEKHPQVRDSDLGTRLVAEVRWFLPPGTLKAFIHAMRDGPWRRGPQAYGELLGLSLFSNLNEPWIQDEVTLALDPATADCPKTRDARLGLAFAAAQAWKECELRHRATTLLLGLVPLADRELAEAIMSAFLSNDKLYADDDSRRILSSVLDRPLLMEVSTIHWFVKRLPDVVTAFPDLVYRLTREMVSRFGVAIADFRTHLAGCGEHLTNLAMTLQRLGGEYRKKGLALFEDLLEIGVSEAKTALVEIDRRPPCVRCRRGPGMR